MGDVQEHTRLSPSHADTWVNCAGAPNLEATVPPDPEKDESEHSRRGTAAHQGFELCMTKDGYTPAFLVGKTMDNGVTLELEDTNAIQVAVDYVKQQIAEAEKHRLPHQLFVEQKLEIGRYLGGREDIKGTSDIQLFYGNTLHVMDYKHGYRHVEAESNLQMILYALGAMAKAYDPKTQRVALREVKMTIIQPRGQDQANPIRSWTVEPDDLFVWSEKLKAAAAATDNPDAPLTPGDKQCQWCRAREICPAREAQVREGLQKAMSIPGAEAPAAPSWLGGEGPINDSLSTPDPTQVVQEPPASTPGSVWEAIGNSMAPEAEALPLETRVALLDQTDMIISFLKDNKEGLRKLAMQGTPVPGHKLIESLGNTAYKATEEEIAKKVGNLKGKDEDGKQKKLVALDEYMPRHLISPTQLLKLVKPRVTKRVYENIESLTHRPVKGPALVPESAAGKPWKPPAEEMFQKQEKPAEPEAKAPALPSFLQ